MQLWSSSFWLHGYDISKCSVLVVSKKACPFGVEVSMASKSIGNLLAMDLIWSKFDLCFVILNNGKLFCEEKRINGRKKELDIGLQC